MRCLVEHGVTGLTFKREDAQAVANTPRATSAVLSRLFRMGRTKQEKFQEQLDIGISSQLAQRLYDLVRAHE